MHPNPPQQFRRCHNPVAVSLTVTITIMSSSPSPSCRIVHPHPHNAIVPTIVTLALTGPVMSLSRPHQPCCHPHPHIAITLTLPSPSHRHHPHIAITLTSPSPSHRCHTDVAMNSCRHPTHVAVTLTSSCRHWFSPSHLVSPSPAHALVYKTQSGLALPHTPVLAVTDMQFMDGTLINLFKPSLGQDLMKAIDNLNMDFGTLTKVDVDTSMY